MPITGNASKVLKNMIAARGKKDGTSMFYATATKQKRTPETWEKKGMDATTAALLGGGIGALGGGAAGAGGAALINRGINDADPIHLGRAIGSVPGTIDPLTSTGVGASGGAAVGALAGLGIYGTTKLLKHILNKRKAH